jgi:hypothetical protein
MNKIIYISGPMTGMKNFNKKAFDDAQMLLTMQGHVVLNPAVNPMGLTYQQYMAIDFAMLSVCNAIYMLTGYENSPGAKAELAYAKSCSFEVFYEDNGLLCNTELIKGCTELTTENVDN